MFAVAHRLLGRSLEGWLVAGLLLLTPLAAFPEQITIARPGLELHVVSSDDDETILELSLGSFHRMPVAIDGETYYELRLDNEGIYAREGAPALPLITRSIIIPDREDVEVQVTDIEYHDLRMPVAPAPGTRSRRSSPALAGDESLPSCDEAGFLPSAIASLGDPYVLRDFRAATLNLCPFVYDSQTRDPVSYTHLTLPTN